MPIDKLTICNFKGFSEKNEFVIKPITLFIGPNSSGKSSCIHALAALAQTIKLSSSSLPIVLDDEYAQVHLGRFIEVIHSKSYSDAIEIGVAINKSARSIRGIHNNKVVSKDDPVNALYTFKSTRRTQDVFIEKAEFEAGTSGITYRIKPKSSEYTVRFNEKLISVKAANPVGMKFSLQPELGKKPAEEFFDTLVFSESINDIIAHELQRTLYLGPFRQSPQRRYPTRGAAPREVGAQGESAITLLANEYVQSKGRAHIKQISEWMETLGLARSIEVSRVGKSDLFDVNVTLTDGNSLPIADLGYGVSQILPVLVQCSFAPKGATLLFEQPELHLHPAAAEKLASVFVDVSKQKNLRIVAETHSRELFMQLFKELREGRVKLDDVAAYEVSREDGKSVFKRIEIEENDGHFEVYNPWDKGICSV